jgi:hypothetical protein
MCPISFIWAWLDVCHGPKVFITMNESALAFSPSRVPFVRLGVGGKYQKNLMPVLGDEEKAIYGKSISV